MQSDPDNIRGLIERIERASEGSRELDKAIMVALMPDTPKAKRQIAGIEFLPSAEPYTASIDAAMTLAKPNWWFSASAPLSEAAYGYSREDQRMPRAGFEMIGEPYSVGARAATIPLAICAAALKAMETPNG